MTGIHITARLANRRAQPEVAVNLVGGSKKNKWLVPSPARRVKNVKGAAQIYFKIQPGINNGSSHRNLRGKMIDLRRPGDRCFHQRPVTYITNRDAQAIPNDRN